MLKKDKTVTDIFNAYSSDVLNYSLSLLKNYDDAKDAVQEVFIRYINSQNNFKGECSYKTWLLTITRNYCFKILRSRSKNSDRIDENFRGSYNSNIETKITLNEILAKLTNEEYEILYLREFAGHTYQEMSEILGISLDNVKVKLYRIRQRLKKYLM